MTDTTYTVRDERGIEDVMVGETSYDQGTLDHWKEYLSEE